jgi:hypothetical protein
MLSLSLRLAKICPITFCRRLRKIRVHVLGAVHHLIWQTQTIKAAHDILVDTAQ